MVSVNSVLIVGAGTAGCVAATRLAQFGISVDVVEIHEDITALGSGITVQGNALRVLREIGAYEKAEKNGYPFFSTGIRLPDGTLLVELDDIQTGGPDLPATMGMERADLARVLVETAQEAGAKFHFGSTVETLSDDGDGVDITFRNGETGRFDLVIGADGVNSAIRPMIGIEQTPEPTGMGIFRVFTSRPESVVRTDLCFTGPAYIAGFCPTAPDSLYAYLVEPAQDRTDMSPEERLEYMRTLSEAYSGPWDDIRERMDDPSKVNYTWFEHMILDAPWWRGRTVLIGDAAHTCPPTVAQGAAQAMEDGLVLADSLLALDDLDAALQSFMDRRYERAKTVVEASVQIGQWMIEGDEEFKAPGLMMQTLGSLVPPP